MVSIQYVIIQWVSLPGKFLLYHSLHPSRNYWHALASVDPDRHMFKDLTVSDRKAAGVKCFACSPREWWMSGFPSQCSGFRLFECRITVKPAGLLLSTPAALEEKLRAGTWAEGCWRQSPRPRGFAAADTEDAFVWFRQKRNLEREPGQWEKTLQMRQETFS